MCPFSSITSHRNRLLLLFVKSYQCAWWQADKNALTGNVIEGPRKHARRPTHDYRVVILDMWRETTEAIAQMVRTTEGMVIRTEIRMSRSVWGATYLDGLGGIVVSHLYRITHPGNILMTHRPWNTTCNNRDGNYRLMRKSTFCHARYRHFEHGSLSQQHAASRRAGLT
jgi:hypothetical protein